MAKRVCGPSGSLNLRGGFLDTDGLALPEQDQASEDDEGRAGNGGRAGNLVESELADDGRAHELEIDEGCQHRCFGKPEGDDQHEMTDQ